MVKSSICQDLELLRTQTSGDFREEVSRKS